MSNTFGVDYSSDLKLELDLAKRLCRVIDTPRSLTVSLLIDYAEWDQLLDLDIRSVDYTDSQHFADDYLVTTMLSKSQNLPVAGIDLEKDAVLGFAQAEALCKETNDRYGKNGSLALPEKGISVQDVMRVRSRMSDLLGPLTKRTLTEIERNFDFGSGANAFVKGRGTVKSDKYDNSVNLTKPLIPFAKSIMGDAWWEHYAHSFEVVEGNQFMTVPKKAKKLRGICPEPKLNAFVQKGIGTTMKKRLLVNGVDIYTQEWNQYLASQAEKLKLATIDLSMASDTMSISAVLQSVECERWLQLLFDVRSDKTLIDGNWVTLEKFSSMGNAFTFELETMLFVAIARSVVPRNNWCLMAQYGDDMIVPQEYASRVIDLLNAFGFKVNEEKSFLAGNFFESCGSDYFNGHNVRPFFLRRRKEDEVDDGQPQGTALPYRVQLANKLRLWATCRYSQISDDRFRSTWLWLIQPKSVRKIPRVPPAFGDLGLVVSDLEMTLRRCSDQLEGILVETIAMVPKVCRKTTLGLLRSALRTTGAGSDMTRGFEPRRYFFLSQPKIRLSVYPETYWGFRWGALYPSTTVPPN